ncbi:acetylornithine deacetylase [Silicimonas algicola]|uniref:Acetylornithine deacetylase n=1 Tax=Silicimonas algicola TaxID=1826607 RepID=A0A316G4L2_9RHOB|nr:acetylornithine deacetylase [Silicimonas algicola]AZQ68438.1 acetylornithine deacetylase [Silicimonas algicola]PWK55861.1 acetylornithine deacetylase [Silicimonas algicola]
MTTLAETKVLLEELVAFPTVSSDSNMAMIAHLASRLDGCGARVEIYLDPSGQKANLFATIGPETDGGIVLSGHTDVVPVADQDWATDPFLISEADGNLYGRGTCDMKGFIAAAVAMAPRFAETVRDRPIHFAFTHDEEIGCIGARALAQTLGEKGLRPSVAIIGEPTSMRIVEGHKGCYEYSTHFTGLEGHGSAPDRGINAVEYAARYVARLLDLKEALKARAPSRSRFDPPWTTINTGAVIGGHAHNVIPGLARVDWEMRPVQAGDAELVKSDLARFCAETLIPAMRAVSPDADIVTETIGEVDGLVPADENEAKEIVMELTGETEADCVAFGTEGGIFQAMGMSVVICGPGSIAQAHKPDEFLAEAQLSDCLQMLDRLGGRLSQ